MAERSWMDEGACVGKPTRYWFPGRGDSLDYAKSKCQDCPVRLQCLEYALAHRIGHGVWGGASELERRAIRRARARSTA